MARALLPTGLRLRGPLDETTARHALRAPAGEEAPALHTWQRFRLLEIKNLVGWSAVQAARAFLVCPNTVLNWEHAADPDSKTVGSMLRPVPPVRRAADVVRATVRTMARLGFGGEDMVARVLARAGWLVSARAIRRYRKEPTVTPRLRRSLRPGARPVP